MKQIANSQTIIDVPPFSRGKRRLLVTLVLLMTIGAATAWWAYKNVFIPNGYRASVQQGKALLLKGGDWFAGKELKLFLELPEGHQATLLARKLLDKETKGDDFQKQRVAAEALALAHHLGEPRALYEAAKAYKAGLLSTQLSGIESKSINDGVKGLELLATRGDPVASYVFALMQSAGLGGLEENQLAADELVQTVYPRLTEIDLVVLMKDLNRLDGDAAYEIFKQSSLKDQMYTRFYWMCWPKAESGVSDKERLMNSWRCFVECLSPYEGTEFPKLSEAVGGARRLLKSYEERAAADWYKKEKIVAQPATPRQQQEQASAAESSKDPEQQDATGYLNGAPVLAQEGLSSFTVDNKQGGKDAVARIYLNGAKPAVRSMFVKAGETFTANKLPPGSYTFRYRFMGSNDTFEADTTFELKEVKMQGGTQFSRSRVTLFQVADGNMSVKKVSPDSF